MSNIILNNQEFKLKYDVNAICYIEEKAGKGITSLLEYNNIGFNLIRLLVTGGIKHQVPNIHPEMVGNFLQELINKGETFDTLFEKCCIALKESGILGKNDKDNTIVGEIVPAK